MINVPPGKKEQIQQRRNRVLDLRIAGLSMRVIADQIGVDASTVKRDLDAMYALISEQQKATVEHLRAIELDRLDKMQMGLWKDATSGKWLAVDRVLAISERRAKLLGLDMPIRNDITTDGKPIEITVQAINYRDAVASLAPGGDE